MEKKTIHFFGENVIDIEGMLSSKLTGGASLTTEHITLPIATGIRMAKDGLKYYGKIQFDPKWMVAINSDAIRIPVDKKYDFEEPMAPFDDSVLGQWMQKNNITSFIDVAYKEKSGGGGAHNSAYGTQAYINGNPTIPLEVRLVVPYGSNFIKDNLPRGLKYDPVFDFDEDMLPSNLNIALEYGKKLTFRSKPRREKYDTINGKIKDEDIVVVNSVKDHTYVQAIAKLLNAHPKMEFYLAATDSMIKALTRNVVYELALKSDMYVSNEDEFNILLDKNISNDEELMAALEEFHEEQIKRKGSIGTICITYGELGAVIYDETETAYFQPAAMPSISTPHGKPVPIVNTNGCGDAFFSIAVIGKAKGDISPIILNYANAAGHLCAFRPTATGEWMATNASIQNYRTNFGNAPIYTYNIQNKMFVPTRL